MPAPNPVRELIKRNLLKLVPFGAFTERIEHFEPFRHRPILASDLDPATISQATVRLLTGANKSWELAGTNAASSGSGLHTAGGVRLTTAGADDDQVILQPASAINSVNQSAFRRVKWNTGQEVNFEVLLSLPSIENVLIKAGLALTNAVDRTTDANQVGFVFDTEGSVSSSNFTAIESVAGTDDETDAENAPTADQTVRLGIKISASRIPRYYVDGVKVHTGNALTDAIDLIPFVAVQALTASAKSLDVYGLRLSRLVPAA